MLLIHRQLVEVEDVLQQRQRSPLMTLLHHSFLKLAPLGVEDGGPTDLHDLGDAVWMLAAM